MAPFTPSLNVTKSKTVVGNFKYGPYASSRTAGAFRLVEVNSLISTNTINVWEFPTIHWNIGSGPTADMQLQSLSSTTYKYVAISHVWDFGFEVNTTMATLPMTNKLEVQLNATDTKTISWDGLIEAARATKHLGANYMWVDFLCLDQVDKPSPDKEKDLQICMMGSIYTYASSVVAMIGGIAAVQGATEPTGWMDRAWTLQESVVNTQTYVYVKWPHSKPLNIPDPSSSTIWTFQKVYTPPSATYDICLILLQDLLDMVDANPAPTAVPSGYVKVLDGMTPKAGDAPRRALRAALLSSDKTIMWTGVWRSMFLRTSTHPVDAVYSIMNIFGIQIDPYRKNRSPTYLFNDLCRKVAAKHFNHGSNWISIGGVAGSDIRYDVESRIIPYFPHAEIPDEPSSDTPPKMLFGKIREWVGFHVDDSPFYIKRFNARFLSQSHPHIINAAVLPIRKSPTGVTSFYVGKIQRKKALSIKIGSMKGRLYYSGDLANAKKRKVKALYVGDVGDMRDKDSRLFPPSSGPPPPNLKDCQYFVFIKYNKRDDGWSIVANGTFRPSGGWSLGPLKYRRILTMGKGSQVRLKMWRTTNPYWLDGQRRSRFRISYGLQPLPDFLLDPRKRNIRWFAKKGSKLAFRDSWNPEWRKVYVKTNVKGFPDDHLARKLQDPIELALVRSSSSTPPKSKTTSTSSRIRNQGALSIYYTYGGWKKSISIYLKLNGVEPILIEENGSKKAKIQYWMSIWFGKKVMYIQMKAHKGTPQKYWLIFAVPYKTKPGEVINGAYLTQPKYDPYSERALVLRQREQDLDNRERQQYQYQQQPAVQTGYAALQQYRAAVYSTAFQPVWYPRVWAFFPIVRIY